MGTEFILFFNIWDVAELSRPVWMTYRNLQTIRTTDNLRFFKK